MAIQTKLTPPGTMQLSTKFLLVVGLVALLLIGGLALLQRALPSAGSLFARKEAEPVRRVEVPEELKPSARPYAELAPKPPPPPVAQPIVRPAAAAVVTPPPPPPAPVVVQAPAPPPPSFIDLWDKQQQAVAQTARQPQAPPEQPKAKPARESWVLTPKDITIKAEVKEGEKGKAKGEEVGREGEAARLIQRAKWAIPKSPLKTIYRSQTLTGRLLQSVSSDVPGGQVKIQLTTPVFDKFGYATTIIPKESIVIAVMQDKAARYGQSRLSINLEQLEFPGGEVVNFKAMIGDQEGANGLKGDVDNHVGKLILATGLSAILNIGVRAAAGTPGRGNFFESPIQSAAGDFGQAIQRDAQSIVDRELRIPPTITVNAGEFCTINLSENVQFNHKPLVVR